jgi:NADH-quinone oxidoreductase subunit J
MSFLLLVFLGLTAFLVISVRNPVHSVLSLISVFLLASILLFCLNVEFLALSFVIIYVGAIAILFLFIVMMLDIKIGDTSFDFLKYGSLSYFLSFIFILEIILPIISLNYSVGGLTDYTWINWFNELDFVTNVQAIGQLLYTYYFVFLLVAGLILFVSVVGALMLTVNLNKLLFQQA